MKVKLVPIDSVYLFEGNPREMAKEQFEKLKGSIKEFGFVEPIVVNLRNDKSFDDDERKPTIVGGNMRYRAAKELGFKEIDIVEIDIDKNREKILNIALNRISGKWDIEKLEKMIYDLSDEELELDLDLTGLDDWELKLYNPAEDVDAEDIEKIIGTDEKPTYVLKIVFGDEAEFEKASRILGGDKRIRNIIRGEKLLEVLDAYEKTSQS
jgi:ParB-like chromosome segregation protein Spo0J